MNSQRKEVHFIGSFMKPYEDHIRRMARQCKPILFIGESGTGKELAAQIVEDELSKEGKKLFIVDCTRFGSRSEAMSELFGHKKGAYTGADHDRKGRLEEAHGNIVFLDELGELPSGVQSLLLRFSEDGKVLKLGGNVTDTTACSISKVLLLAATTEAEKIHLPLFNRFIPIYLPPLRWRKLIVDIKKMDHLEFRNHKYDVYELLIPAQVMS